MHTLLRSIVICIPAVLFFLPVLRNAAVERIAQQANR